MILQFFREGSSSPGLGFSSAPFLSRSWLEDLIYHPTEAWASPSAPPRT